MPISFKISEPYFFKENSGKLCHEARAAHENPKGARVRTIFNIFLYPASLNRFAGTREILLIC